MVKVLQKAPDFELFDTENKRRTLTEILSKHKKVILLFYRGDWCSICAKQLKLFAKDYQGFRKLGVEIVAISVDSIKIEKVQKEKMKLPFILLSDPNHKIIDLYNVFDKGGLSGKIHGKKEYAKPAIFIINKDKSILFQYVGKNFLDRPKNKILLEKIKDSEQ